MSQTYQPLSDGQSAEGETSAQGGVAQHLKVVSLASLLMAEFKLLFNL